MGEGIPASKEGAAKVKLLPARCYTKADAWSCKGLEQEVAVLSVASHHAATKLHSRYFAWFDGLAVQVLSQNSQFSLGLMEKYYLGRLR